MRCTARTVYLIFPDPLDGGGENLERNREDHHCGIQGMARRVEARVEHERGDDALGRAEREGDTHRAATDKPTDASETTDGSCRTAANDVRVRSGGGI